MKYKIGDKLRVLNPEECGKYSSLASPDYIIITGISESTYGYYYDIYDNYDQVIDSCVWCFEDEDLAPYNEPEKLKQPRPTYKKKIIYVRSDGIVFEKDQVKSGDEYILIELLKEHANLYKAWSRRKF